MSSVGLKINHIHVFSNLEGGEGGGGYSPENLKTNKAGEAISGHFLRANLPSVNEPFKRILLPFILYARFRYKT